MFCIETCLNHFVRIQYETLTLVSCLFCETYKHENSDQKAFQSH